MIDYKDGANFMDDIYRMIHDTLTRIETTYNITILYAFESGSRAWGFESEDSDYDVRFIYIHPTPWYLSIGKRRDVIEESSTSLLDLSGWDLTKALDLFRRSNPPLLEWIQSPIIYMSKSSLIESFRELLPHYYAPISCMYHYLHMAEGNMREYLKGDEVWTKKYFYVLRPILACMWIEMGIGAPPMEFRKLLEATVLDDNLLTEIEILLKAKREGHELRRGPRNEIISNFLENQLYRLKSLHQPPAETKDPQVLDQLFLDILIEINGREICVSTKGKNGGLEEK